jgi:hypothetical protein
MDERTRKVDLSALLVRSLVLQNQAQQLLRRSAQTMQGARQACAQARSFS